MAMLTTYYQAFDAHAAEYDAWYDSQERSAIFAMEADCLRPFLHRHKRPYLEIGVGSGRFAQALGIEFGIDPALTLLLMAESRGFGLAVVFITGILLLWNRGWIWNDWALIAKLAVFVLIVSILSYVHFTIQPRIEKVLEGLKAGEELPAKDRPTLMSLRSKRKKFTATCLFIVLATLFLGVQMTARYSPWFLIILLVAAGLFAYRAYRKPLPAGWF